MKDFGAFGSGLNFAQYRTLRGPLKELHPGVKIATLTAGIIITSMASSVGGLGLLLVFVFVSAGISGISPASMLKPLLPVTPFLILVVLLHGLTLPRGAGEGLLSISDILPMSIMLLRIVVFMTMLGLMSAILSTSEVSYGIEALLSPLERFGLPAGDLGLVATVTFRFIPFLRDESERLAKAQTARGGSLGFRSRNPFRRVRASLPIMIPLFIGTLRRAELLAESMHLRGYDGSRTRSRLHRYEVSPGDIFWILLTAAVLGSALALQFLNIDIRIYDLLSRIISMLRRISA